MHNKKKKKVWICMIYPYVKVKPNMGGIIYQCDGFLAGFLASSQLDDF
jgi:hypothetical protein